MQEHQLTKEQIDLLLTTLEQRFENNKKRHPAIAWEYVADKLMKLPHKLWSLYEMERTGGEPDVVDYPNTENHFVFMDCASESPKGRRSVSYDEEARITRKDFAPEKSAQGMAEEMGITVLTTAQYQFLQNLQPVDTKTSSWLETPKNIRDLGGALFGDNRYQTAFIYHNGAQSYYAARGFRAMLVV